MARAELRQSDAVNRMVSLMFRDARAAGGEAATVKQMLDDTAARLVASVDGSHHIGGFAFIHPGEKPAIDDLRQIGIHPRQQLQRLSQPQDLGIRRAVVQAVDGLVETCERANSVMQSIGRSKGLLLVRDLAPAVALLLPVLAAAIIDKTTVFSGKGVINAELNATMFAGANVSGNVCGVFCTGETSIVSLGIGDPRELKIIGCNSGSNTVTFLGKTTTNALPKSFPAAGGLPVSASVNAVNLSANGVGGQSAALQTSQEVAGVYVDVAGALANAFGIPGALLSGSALGFDYNVFSAKVGFGINLAYREVTSVTDTATRYTFSGKVERLDPTTGLYKSVGQSLTLRDNQLAILRAPGQANLGIMPGTPAR